MAWTALGLLSGAIIAAAAPAPQGGSNATATDDITSASTSQSAAADASSTGMDDVAMAAATARTLSPTSNVEGKAFDRILTIYLETTGYQNAIADRLSSFPLCQTKILTSSSSELPGLDPARNSSHK